jgi:hypothetical protein
MSLIVEDGTGLPNAESYVSVATATAYVSTFYFPIDPLAVIWNAALNANSGANCEIALRRSTRDLDAVFGPVYWSEMLKSTQALQFPRQPFYEWNRGRNNFQEGINGYFYQDSSTAVLVTGIPVGLVQATVELALILLNGFDITGPTDRSATTSRDYQRVGTLITEYNYFFAASETAMNTRKVSTLIAPFVSSDPSGANVTLQRG